MGSGRWIWACALVALGACRSGSEEPRFAKDEPAAEAREQAEKKAPSKPNADPAAAQAPAYAKPPGAGAGKSKAADPEGGEFTLDEALEGLEGEGELKATITTNLGAFECELFDDKAPNTVANFVGLARGKRPFYDSGKGEWVTLPYYDGTSFHRVIPGFMIQGGDRTGTGAGSIGYTIPDELHPSLGHNRAGLLCMANRGPNTNGAQFFILDAPAPHLTRMNSYTIFGECGPTELVSKIAGAPKDPQRRERPKPPVTIESVEISRVSS